MHPCEQVPVGDFCLGKNGASNQLPETIALFPKGSTVTVYQLPPLISFLLNAATHSPDTAPLTCTLASVFSPAHPAPLCPPPAPPVPPCWALSVGRIPSPGSRDASSFSFSCRLSVHFLETFSSFSFSICLLNINVYQVFLWSLTSYPTSLSG